MTLRERIEASGLSVDTLAKKFGRGPGEMRSKITNERWSLLELRDLAEMLGCTLGELTGVHGEVHINCRRGLK